MALKTMGHRGFHRLLKSHSLTMNSFNSISDKLLQILKDLNEQGKTVVIATHDYPLIRRFPARIITVDEQKIYETVITRKENKG